MAVKHRMVGQQFWFTNDDGKNFGVSSLETNHFVDPKIRPAFGEKTEWDLLEPTCFADMKNIYPRKPTSKE